jgi:uncharacterized protein involved in exopolysaccharide biosynthesis
VGIPLWSIMVIGIAALLITGSAFFYKTTIPDTKIKTKIKIDNKEKPVEETETSKSENKNNILPDTSDGVLNPKRE